MPSPHPAATSSSSGEKRMQKTSAGSPGLSRGRWGVTASLDQAVLNEAAASREERSTGRGESLEASSSFICAWAGDVDVVARGRLSV
eukprot:scaffold97647_cov30-Tisochrysis_lutea.AAC.3